MAGVYSKGNHSTARHCEAAESSRYVTSIAAKQSSAGSVTYVSVAYTTGLLRTCNALRIASPPVLRNDELLTLVPRPIPLLGGVARSAGVVPRAVRGRNQRPNLRPYPLCGGVPPQRRGGRLPRPTLQSPPLQRAHVPPQRRGVLGCGGYGAWEGDPRVARLDGGTGLLRPAGRAMSIGTRDAEVPLVATSVLGAPPLRTPPPLKRWTKLNG
ncbi:MAG: hypothetical protein LBM98_05085 [Oscillospiraceae bacterium]|nr:hypothetical protein [Oscillospiraceae bacterium]